MKEFILLMSLLFAWMTVYSTIKSIMNTVAHINNLKGYDPKHQYWRVSMVLGILDCFMWVSFYSF